MTPQQPPPPTSSPTEVPSLLAEKDIQFICDIAERCGKIAFDMRESVAVHQKDGPTDLVTDADIALSTLLLKELGAQFPNDFLISEEEVPEDIAKKSQRIWYIDPIDGTDNYVSGDGQYSVMLGLLVNGQPHFGCVHSPANSVTYFGGPGYGAWIRSTGEAPAVFRPKFEGDMKSPIRLIMGFRDRKNNPWVQELPGIRNVSAGSVGLKVAKVVKDEADVFVHLSGKLKYWDTVGPIAIALAAGLEAGTLKEDSVSYPSSEVRHPESVIIGRPGSLAWARETISQRFFS